MGNVPVQVVNETDMAVNFGMYIVLLYHSSNNIQPHQTTHFDINCVWYSLEVIPWYGPKSKLDGNMVEYERLEQAIPSIAKKVAESGKDKLYDLTFICKNNCNKGRLAEQLQKLLFFKNGFYACNKKYCITGGPDRKAVINDPLSIDLTEDFQQLQINEC